MQAGDLVKCNRWVYNGRTGIIVNVQKVDYCMGAYVLLDIGVKLIRLENLKVIK
mgnify:CR=1 FL=1|jgi:hypothetical protein